MVEVILKYGPAHEENVSVSRTMREFDFPVKGWPGGKVTYIIHRLADGRFFGLPKKESLKRISTRYSKASIKDAPDGAIWKDHRDKHNNAMKRDNGLLLAWCHTEEIKAETYHTYYTV